MDNEFFELFFDGLISNVIHTRALDPLYLHKKINGICEK